MYTFPKEFYLGRRYFRELNLKAILKNDIKYFLTIGILKDQVPFVLVSDR